MTNPTNNVMPKRRRISRRALSLFAAAAAGLGLLPLAAGVANAATPAAHQSATTGDVYIPVTPFRIVDTRSGSGCSNITPSGTLGAASTSTITVVGATACAGTTGSVPSGATAVAVNVTALDATTGTYVTVYPAGATRPTVSNLNVVAGEANVANMAMVQLSSSGTLSVYNNAGTVNLVVDVEGYYMPASTTTGDTYTPASSPFRIVDTRSGSGCSNITPSGMLAAGTASTVQVTGATACEGTSGTVPSGATAAVVNVTVVDPSGPGYVTLYPAGATQPTVSNIGFGTGETIANRAVVTLSSSGAIDVVSNVSTNVVIDVTGWFTTSTSGDLYTPVTPFRIVDSRSGSGCSNLSPAGTLSAGETATVTVSGATACESTTATAAPTGTTAAVMNVTAVRNPGSTADYLTVFPSGTPPMVSDINLSPANPAGAQPNLVIGTLSSTGTVDVYNHAGSMDLVVDVSGYFYVPFVTATAYAVSPSAEQLPTVSTSTSTSGDVTYTVTGINSTNTPSGTVDIALFPSTGTDAPVQTNGSWTFASEGGTGAAGAAAGQGTTNDGTPSVGCAGTSSCTGYIASVNGVPTSSPLTQVGSVAVSAGTVSFVVNSFELDGTTPVVYTVPTGGAADTLMVGANGEPQSGYAFGVGGVTQWVAAPAPAGTYSNFNVVGVNPSQSTFEACAGAPETPPCWTFGYGTTGDSFTYPAPNGVSGGVVLLTAAEFGSNLSGPVTSAANLNLGAVPGDVLATIDYNPSGVSSFGYGVDVPAAPTSLSVSTGSGGLAVAWTAPPNPDVAQDSSNTAYYDVYRATVTGGSVGTFGSIGLVTATGGSPPPTTFTDTSVVPGDTYEYAVVAVGDKNGDSIGGVQQPGPASVPSYAVTVTSAAPASLAPLSTSTAIGYGSGDTTGTLSAGDVLSVTFNGPVTLDSSSFDLEVTDGTSTATLNSSNTSATIAGSGNEVLYTITSPVPSSPGVLSFSASNPLEILSQSGVSNSVGQWNLVGSGATNVSGVTRVFGGANSAISSPAAPLVGQAPASGATSVNVTCNEASSYTASVYSENGTLLGSAPCNGSSAVAVATSTTVAAGSVLLADVQAGSSTSPTGYAGLSTLTAGFAPDPIAPEGSLADSATVSVTVSSLPGAVVYLSFVPATGGGSATVASGCATPDQALGATPAPCTANAAGQIVISYTSSPNATLLTSTSTDVITAADASSSPAFEGTDGYTYNL